MRSSRSKAIASRVSREEDRLRFRPTLQVIRADGKFILPGLWDSQVSYNWYYGEVMLNYGITSTIDVGIAGEIGAPHRDGVHKGLVRGPRPFTGLSRFTTEPVGGTGLETPGTPGRTPKTGQEARELVRAWVELGADMIQFAEGGLPMDIYKAGADEARRLGKPTFMRAYGPVLGPREAAMLGTRNLPHSAGIGRTVARMPVTSEDDPRNEADLYSEMDEAKAKDLIQLLVKQNVALTPTFRATYGGFSERLGQVRAGRSPVLRNGGSGVARRTTRPSGSRRRWPFTADVRAAPARCANGGSRGTVTRCAFTRCSRMLVVTSCQAQTRTRHACRATA